MGNWYPAPRGTYGATLIWDSTKQGSYTTLKYTRRKGCARPSWTYRPVRRNAAKLYAKDLKKEDENAQLS
jgi:hypothetical protein